jgi:deazaflavin-dependent oxidoreductase (nitroreductase family)
VRDATVRRLSALHAGLSRATNGIVGRRLVANDMLLLTTVGRRTGRPHTVPLLYLGADERLVVIASYGGRDRHPEWYLNLVDEPNATVQIRSTTSQVRAETMHEEDRAAWWPRIVEAYGDYALYQSRTRREIPTVWLHPAFEG